MKLLLLLTLFFLINGEDNETNFYKMQISLVKQAIDQLKKKIERIKSSSVKDAAVTNFSFKVKENEKLEDEVKRDETLEKQIFNYYDKHPKSLKLDDIKQSIRENGLKEIKGLMNIMEKEPEKILHSVDNLKLDKTYTFDLDKIENKVVPPPLKFKETSNNLNKNKGQGNLQNGRINLPNSKRIKKT